MVDIKYMWYNGGRLGSNEWKIAQQKVSICWAFTRWLSPLPGLVTALFTPRPIWGVPRPAKTARSGWYFDWKYLHFLPRSNQGSSPRLSWNDPVIIISNVQTPSMLQLSSVLSEMADKSPGSVWKLSEPSDSFVSIWDCESDNADIAVK